MTWRFRHEILPLKILMQLYKTEKYDTHKKRNIWTNGIFQYSFWSNNADTYYKSKLSLQGEKVSDRFSTCNTIFVIFLSKSKKFEIHHRSRNPSKNFEPTDEDLLMFIKCIQRQPFDINDSNIIPLHQFNMKFKFYIKSQLNIFKKTIESWCYHYCFQKSKIKMQISIFLKKKLWYHNHFLNI